MAMEKILIVDDDPNICEVLRTILVKEGYSALTANDGDDALIKFTAMHPDLVLLDVMMPGMNGYQVMREIQKKSNVPVILVTAKSEPNDEALGLDLGAEDYITKPIDKTSLLARIRARLRKNGPAAPDQGVRRGRVDYDKLTVDMDGYVLRVNGKVIETPPKELELLYCLASNPNHVYTRDQLLDEVWGFEYYGDSRTIDVHIKRLREKLEGVSDKWELRTVWGVGYKFAVPDEAE
ncbi:MAG: response regulator transcription factor [Oscillospiraceae bacterium]|nr:response regulator transcription factor [Oscillospiraceae bacterium]